ncbi:hypothetical protein SAMN05421538_11436 [Paracoccus isoporae]|uniref:Uncharacterized protein n=1 Tax=Paracoccus isoporae TaxID=591205 RepID=A0A1G7GQ19_9RHOB|nr:hypothetical protein [Paracoccus isoporae]SDE90240.1 hypothetical protein SAMN05421538_11436 [Paracoccus isoporae]
MNAPEGGFTGALRLVGFVLGVAGAFVFLPEAFGRTWPWLSSQVLQYYGPDVRAWAPTFWHCVLVLSIYALIRAALYFAVSLLGFVLAFALLARRGRD